MFAAQTAAFVVLCARLSRGRRRLPPIEPRIDGETGTTVSVVVPARNEALRIGACLDGLRAQGAPLVETIVVDGASTDDTPAIVDAATSRDTRIRRISEPPRPGGYVGRPWAIAAGCAEACGEWIMIVDADTAPKPGMVAGAVIAAQTHELDVVSFAPRIIAPSAGARWLQPSFLTTLVYRFGPPGLDETDPERVMANGQCFLMRRSVLERAGGYVAAADSFCDDIRIARHLASRGARLGFLDGRLLLDVVMYRTGTETWRAWPRSLNMRDATETRWRWLDAMFLLLAQGLPVVIVAGIAIAFVSGVRASWLAPLAAVNIALLGVRVLFNVAISRSFAFRGAPFWLSPLADIAAVSRVVETIVRRPREWRGAPRLEPARR